MTGGGHRRIRSSGGRRRLLVIVAAATAVATGVVIVVIAMPGLRVALEGDAAREARISASATEPGSNVDALVDRSSWDGADAGAEWRSTGPGLGWVAFEWERARSVAAVELTAGADPERRPRSVLIEFGDGSQLAASIGGERTPQTLPFRPRAVDSLRVIVTSTADGDSAPAVAELRVLEASSDRSRGGAPIADARSGERITGSSMSTVDSTSGAWRAAGEGTWVEISWPEPREVASLRLVGSADAPGTIENGTLVFDDGSRVPVGAVTRDEAQDTVIAFPPRVTDRVRFVVDAASGGDVALSILEAGLVGDEPRAMAASTDLENVPEAAPALTDDGTCPDSAAAARSADGDAGDGDGDGDASEPALMLLCPSATSRVDGRSVLHVHAPGSDQVDAVAWSADGARDPRPVTAEADVGDDGVAELSLDFDRLDRGPVTVRLRGDAAGGAAAGVAAAPATYLQFVNDSGTEPAEPPESRAAGGMTLAFAEEFDAPVSASRTGDDARYAASKPRAEGADEFGEAVFADPDEGLGNVSVADGLLQLRVAPLPDGVEDPLWDREHSGGILSSGRVGGSGFAAQYGYFEARMLAPAADGTWGAFWMLPSASLVEQRDEGPEIDAVELYGHDPLSTCHATHYWSDGEDDADVRCVDGFDDARDALSWHTYGARVTPLEIVYYIDGHEVARAPQIEGGDEPMFFMVNLALGGGWPIDLDPVGGRAALWVDWIRVYT